MAWKGSVHGETTFHNHQSLQAAHARVTFINGQGTLVPQPSSWDNELHPERAGFSAFADLFQQHLKALFPTQVL